MRLPREKQVPKSAVKVTDKASGAVAYLYNSRDPQYATFDKPVPCAALFVGKSNKPVWRYKFPNEKQREARVREGFASAASNVLRKQAAQAARKAVGNPYKVGDLFKWVWGYDQTNVNYFEVTESKGRYVTVREIKSASFETSGMTGKCSPLPGEFKENEKPKRCLAGDGSIRVQPWARGGRAYYLKPEKMVGSVPVYGSDGFSTYA